MAASRIGIDGASESQHGVREKETAMSVALFWGVGLAALSWLALDIAEWGED